MPGPLRLRRSPWIIVIALVSALASAAAAGTVAPTSMGARVTNYSQDGGQAVVRQFFSRMSGPGFTAINTLDARSGLGDVWDVAASFPLAELDPTDPVALRIPVTEAWGAFSAAGLGISYSPGDGTVTMEDFSGLAPESIDPTISVPTGDYHASPLLFDLDVTSTVAWIRDTGFDHMVVLFHATGGAHAAYMSIGAVLLVSGPATVPEPSSSILLATAATVLGFLRLTRRHRRVLRPVPEHADPPT